MEQMNNSYVEIANNLLIFTVYAIVVTLVFNQALKSLETKIVVKFDADLVNEQLAEQNLQDAVEVSFGFAPSYRLDELKSLKLSVKNKSPDEIIAIDWNQSYLINFQNVAGRLIRVVGDMTEIPASQSPTTLYPGQSAQEQLSNEAIADPLFDPKQLKTAAQERGRFIVRLILKFKSMEDGTERSCRLRCPFVPSKLRWSRALTIAMQPK